MDAVVWTKTPPVFRNIRYSIVVSPVQPQMSKISSEPRAKVAFRIAVAGVVAGPVRVRFAVHGMVRAAVRL